MRHWRLTALLLCAISVVGVHYTADAQSSATITILHINDVHSTDVIEQGRIGGLGRASTLLKRLKRSHSPVLMTLGGDYLSPSAIGTAVVDGEPLAGRQMVAALNEVGIDWAVFGNHEFDLSESAFRARMAETRFPVVSSNVTDVNGKPFPGTVRSAVVPIQAHGRTIRLGLIGLTTDLNRRPWVRYAPPVESAREQIAQLKGKVDAVIALTHLPLSDDQELVNEVLDIDLVLGGHEHENMQVKRGRRFTPIIKADSNVRTGAVVTLTFGKTDSRPAVSARIEVMDESIQQDPIVEGVVRKWTGMAFDAFRKGGFEPERTVAVSSEVLDGRDSVVRNQPGRLTDVIGAGFDREAGGVDVAIVNGGSIRINDILQPGPVTEYDVIRVLPFGGRVVRASFDGALLSSVLNIGLNNQGSGGFLHAHGVSREGARWMVKGKPIDPAARYVVATTDFLLSGGETNLGFLTRTNPAVHDVQELSDVRFALMNELRAIYPAK
jgi:5'-nucleotidase / UDP-sugar diphosphatase